MNAVCGELLILPESQQFATDRLISPFNALLLTRSQRVAVQVKW